MAIQKKQQLQPQSNGCSELSHFFRKNFAVRYKIGKNFGKHFGQLHNPEFPGRILGLA